MSARQSRDQNLAAQPAECGIASRRRDVRQAGLNGLDYLEVGSDGRTLVLYLLGKAPRGLKPAHFAIRGGRRVRNIQVVSVETCKNVDPERDDCVVVRVDRPGDFSTYRICLVDLDERGRPTGNPFPGFDRRYACLDFSFVVNCPTGLDCKETAACPPDQPEDGATVQPPAINYLARDYTALRQMIFDRLAAQMPDWKERHIPDMGVALVELMAYVGDYLSYYQDAVATEAYLDIARRRISVRRHARLVDYAMHEGNNARAWVHVRLEGGRLELPGDAFFFITSPPGLPSDGRPLTAAALAAAGMEGDYEVFEPLALDLPSGASFPSEIAGASPHFRWYEEHNEIHFYTWGERKCCLPPGSTSATLRDDWAAQSPAPLLPSPKEADDPRQYKPSRGKAKPNPEAGQPPEPVNPGNQERPRRLANLQPGDLLLIEELIGPHTGSPADADPAHRHVVRLTAVRFELDELYEQPVVEVEWAPEDALPFPVCISAVVPEHEDCPCVYLENISVARGNLLLVDHGRTVEQTLEPVPTQAGPVCCEAEGELSETEILPGAYSPVLAYGPLTFRQPPLPGAAAARLVEQDPRRALPVVRLEAQPPTPGGPEWIVRRDLLDSRGDDQDFMVEVDDEGRGHLRFGDGDLGERLTPGTRFSAVFRVGNELAGNVGAGTINRLVLRNTSLSGLRLFPYNPLPAVGGTAPETLAEVKRFAPHAFRSELQRAVVAEDYATLAQRSPAVQRAAAQLDWTGSWYEARVAVDAFGGEAGPDLLARLERDLYPYRRIGHDLAMRPAVTVPLDIHLKVCVRSDFLSGHVRAALRDLFSSRRLPDGRLGFFHPDELTFGQGIYLSRLVSAALAVPGVENVIVERLERFGRPSPEAVTSGVLALGPFEIAQMDNDPNFPERGRIELVMTGGR